MPRILMSLFSLFLTLAGFVAQISGDARTSELLAQARAALGGEKTLAKVHGLSAAGTFTRVLPDRQLAGDMTIDLQLPDKMLRTESVSPFGDATIVTLQGVNGDQVLRNARTIGGGPNMIVRMAPPAAGSDAEAQPLRNGRAEMVRLRIALFLTPPPSMPVDFAYGGEAEAEDGKADVLDVKGPGSFVVRLFLDKTTHRPLMLSYKGVAPTMVVRRQEGGPPPDSPTVERPAAPQAPPLVDITMFFGDYKETDGVWMPHHVSRSVDGKPSEDWTFKSVKLNPAFKADAFSAK